MTPLCRGPPNARGTPSTATSVVPNSLICTGSPLRRRGDAGPDQNRAYQNWAATCCASILRPDVERLFLASGTCLLDGSEPRDSDRQVALSTDPKNKKLRSVSGQCPTAVAMRCQPRPSENRASGPFGGRRPWLGQGSLGWAASARYAYAARFFTPELRCSTRPDSEPHFVNNRDRGSR
jgi:hypothetical protein